MSGEPTIVGLCAICDNARIVESRRGSRFWLCALSRTDMRFPRYPRLPVLQCSGHSPGSPRNADSPARRAGDASAE